MLRKIYQYRPDLKEKARHNRNHPTFAEKLLWFGLQSKRLGIDFDRQKPIGNFILDFYSKELNLGIELDGDSHEGQESYDVWRQSELEKLGIKLIRFQNEDGGGFSFPPIHFETQTFKFSVCLRRPTFRP